MLRQSAPMCDTTGKRRGATRYLASFAALVVAAAASAIMASTGPAAGHHQVEPPPQTTAGQAQWTSGLGLIASIVLAVAIGAAALWVRGPQRLRSRTVLRFSLGSLLAASVLAACASSGGVATLASDEPVRVLFTAAGTDALAATVQSESQAPGTGAGLPDLVGFTGGNFSTDIIDFAGVTMLAYSFDGIVGNVGPGPLDIYGNPQLADPTDPNSHDVWQRQWDGTAWTNIAKPPIRFEAADSHNHFHLMELAKYSLYDKTQQIQIAPSQKVGFCFLDSQPLGHWSAGKSFEGAAQISDGSAHPYSATDRADSFCRAGSPHAEALHMGISPGWGDLYAQTLKLQWVDISDVPPGIYTLASEMDPNNVIVESNEDNNGPVFAESTMAVWGYRAAPSVIRTSGPIDIMLEAASTGPNLPAPEFTITAGPTNGTIPVGVGAQVPGGLVSYVPNPGFMGIDTIEFSVRDPQNPYPITPTKSVAVILVGEKVPEPFAISGARDQIHRGGGLELSIVSDDTLDPSTVMWSVNGIPGGDSAVGTISPSGHYQAPNAVGEVQISASSPAGSVASTTVRIAVAPNHAPFIDEPMTYQGEGELLAPNDPFNRGRRLTELKVDEPVAILVPVVDLNGDQLLLSAAGLPSGLTMSSATGAITGSPTTSGNYQVTVSATDGAQTTTRVFELVIDD